MSAQRVKVRDEGSTVPVEPSLVLPLPPRQDVQQGRLARTRSAHQSDQPVRLEHEIHVLQSVHDLVAAAVTLHEVARFEQSAPAGRRGSVCWRGAHLARRLRRRSGASGPRPPPGGIRIAPGQVGVGRLFDDHVGRNAGGAEHTVMQLERLVRDARDVWVMRCKDQRHAVGRQTLHDGEHLAR